MTMRRPRSTREYQSDQSSAFMLDCFLVLFTRFTMKETTK
jgi:hypothetical protein